MKESKHRLPGHVVPERYKITLQPNLADFVFMGSEQIKLRISKATKELTLHSVDLTITKVIFKQNKKQFLPIQTSVDKKHETITFIFKESLYGSGELDLDFSGEISGQLRGFYKSSYKHGKVEKHLATTQFEATDARRAFPCFDEPSMKAIFEVNIVAPKNLQVISNTSQKEILPHSKGYKIVKFEASPKMSSYLLAFIVGELEHLKTKTKRGVQIKVHTTPGKKHLAKFSLDFTRRALEYLEDYFGIKYPLPALDLIAIPDFAAGAMENWGAITFRETALLVDEDHTSLNNRQRVAEVIAHELVHQWFGNLVTMEWWTHLWLNESFACYAAYLVVDELYPEWKFFSKFALVEQSYAYEADSLLTTHPIEVEVKYAHEINEIFDGISYSKGASILHMLRNYVGAENFRLALQKYLKQHSYKNTSSLHLWEAFELQSKKPIKKMVQGWLSQSGYPLVGFNVEGDNIKITQERFSLTKAKHNELWQIPLQIQLKKDVVSDQILVAKKEQVIKLPEDFDFIKFNSQEFGFYITAYPVKYLALLIDAIKKDYLPATSRLMLIKHTFLLVKAGKLSLDVYLELICQVHQLENSYVVWAEINSNLQEITAIYASALDKTSLANFTEFKKSLFVTILNKLGYQSLSNDTDNQKLLRALAIGQAGLNGYKPAIVFAENLVAKIFTKKKVDHNLRAGCLAIVAQNINEANYKKYISRYQNTLLQEERVQILYALLKTKSLNLQSKFIEFIFSGSVRSQDLPFVLMSGLSQVDFSEKIWEVIKHKIAQLEKDFSGSKLLGRIFSGAAVFSTETLLAEFSALTKKHLTSEKLVITQTKESIKLNIAWKKRDLPLFLAYLKDFAKTKN